MIVDCSCGVLTRKIERTRTLRLKKVAAKAQMLGYSLFAMRAQADRKSLLQSATEKTPGALPPGTLQRTLAIIMGGGAGTRLFPLTKDRAKPAVPLGGKYRIVDISISNCLNSGLRSIYLLTQFNSMSLHRHIQASYKFDNFSRQLCGHSRRTTNARGLAMVPGNRRCGEAKHALLP
jgi:ADP-glucose pyrophosphorylase